MKIECLWWKDRVGEKTKTEDSELKTSSTSKGESVGALNVCWLRLYWVLGLDRLYGVENQKLGF